MNFLAYFRYSQTFVKDNTEQRPLVNIYHFFGGLYSEVWLWYKTYLHDRYRTDVWGDLKYRFHFLTKPTGIKLEEIPILQTKLFSLSIYDAV